MWCYCTVLLQQSWWHYGAIQVDLKLTLQMWSYMCLPGGAVHCFVGDVRWDFRWKNPQCSLWHLTIAIYPWCLIKYFKIYCRSTDSSDTNLNLPKGICVRAKYTNVLFNIRMTCSIFITRWCCFATLGLVNLYCNINHVIFLRTIKKGISF